jgi:hypothetical protein
MFEESQVEGCKHQNDSDVHHQSIPEIVPEDQDIQSDDDGYHRHHVRHGNHRSGHRDSNCDLSFRKIAVFAKDRKAGFPVSPLLSRGFGKDDEERVAGGFNFLAFTEMT